VDIEPVRARRHIMRVARRLLGEETAALLDRLPAPESDAAFMHAWTQREAFVKATGGTLFRTTDPLVFRWPRPLTAEQQAVADATWTIVPCAAGEGRAATVVAAGEIGSLRIFDFLEIDSL
jgi:4'-phosphopantetheinyl transferase